jgi:hypothetical protein
MPGFRILYAPPHLLGPIQGWSGMGAPGGSWLIDRAVEMNFNAIWFSPMHQTSQVEKKSHGQKVSGSLYAIRNHFTLDPEFSSGSSAMDIKHYKHFVSAAKKKGLTVFADLVFNHVAADHPLVQDEERLLQKIQDSGSWKVLSGGPEDEQEPIGVAYTENGAPKTYHFLFKHDLRQDEQGHQWLSRRICGPDEDPWSDVAQINYDSPAAHKFFLTDKNAYWKKQIDWYMDTIGITAFRCDAAYMLAPGLWQEVINYARGKNPDAFFMAETLGGPDEKVTALGKARSPEKKAAGKDRPAFDLAMLSNHWWNFTDRGLPDQENPLLNTITKFGGTGSPDNHDTLRTVAGHFMAQFNAHARRDDVVARISIRNYAISTFLGNSVYMQLGYELCNQKQNNVFKGKTSPQDRQNLEAERGDPAHPLNITQSIRRINDIKKSLGVENCQADFKDISELDNGRLIRIHVAYRDPDQNGKVQAEAILLVNKKLEDGPVRFGREALQELAEKGFAAEGGAAGYVTIDDVMILRKPAPQDKNIRLNKTGYSKNESHKI